MNEEGMMTLLLGERVEGLCNRVMEEVGECIVYWLSRWWHRRKKLC